MTSFRIDKYKERGYKIKKSEELKLLVMLNSLPIHSWEDAKKIINSSYGNNILMSVDMDSEFSTELLLEALDDVTFSTECMYSLDKETALYQIRSRFDDNYKLKNRTMFMKSSQFVKFELFEKNKEYLFSTEGLELYISPTKNYSPISDWLEFEILNEPDIIFHNGENLYTANNIKIRSIKIYPKGFPKCC